MHAPQSPGNGSLQSRHSGLFAFFAGLLLLFMAFLAGGSALRESVTIDEVAHIGAGVSYLQKLDLRFNPEHPPLPKVEPTRTIPTSLGRTAGSSFLPFSASGFLANGSSTSGMTQ